MGFACQPLLTAESPSSWAVLRANALAWTWYLLSGAPEVEQQLHEEVDRVLGGRMPTVADLPRLPLTEQVITESMRLYPPAWIIGRRAIGEYEVGGYTLPPRTVLVAVASLRPWRLSQPRPV